jgi:hypothetical protein
MRVTLTIDPANSSDSAMYAEARGWLHHTARNAWTVEETVADAEDDDAQLDVLTLTFEFHDHLDADDFYRWSGLHGRGRRS